MLDSMQYSKNAWPVQPHPSQRTESLGELGQFLHVIPSHDGSIMSVSILYLNKRPDVNSGTLAERVEYLSKGVSMNVIGLASQDGAR